MYKIKRKPGKEGLCTLFFYVEDYERNDNEVLFVWYTLCIYERCLRIRSGTNPVWATTSVGGLRMKEDP